MVIISGCAHAGIVNTTLFAQQITGVKKIYALIGGFHLTGKDWKPRIKQTIHNLQQIKPKIIVPMHCTGWRGKYAIHQSIPNSFIFNSVGNLYHL